MWLRRLFGGPSDSVGNLDPLNVPVPFLYTLACPRESELCPGCKLACPVGEWSVVEHSCCHAAHLLVTSAVDSTGVRRQPGSRTTKAEDEQKTLPFFHPGGMHCVEAA